MLNYQRVDLPGTSGTTSPESVEEHIIGRAVQLIVRHQLVVDEGTHLVGGLNSYLQISSVLRNTIIIWQCVKTLYPCSSHQNSWDLWMFIPLNMVLIGIDPTPCM